MPKKFICVQGLTALLSASTAPMEAMISCNVEKQVPAWSQPSAVTTSSRYATRLKPCDLMMYPMALMSLWQYIAVDLRPTGIVTSKYNFPHHISPEKFQSLGSTNIFLYAPFKSHFIRVQPAPFSLTNFVKASTDGYLRPVASPYSNRWGFCHWLIVPGETQVHDHLSLRTTPLLCGI